MNIIAYNRDSENKFVNLDFPVEFVALDELCQRSDFITVHMPKTSETVNLIAKKQLALMKKEAIIINTARGGIINEEDLLEALKNNKIRGAALDVFVSEGENLNMDLISLPNVLATPHIAGVSQEGQKRRSIATAENVIGFFRSGNIKNLINNYKKS
jgi:phosphoglycerate dehydrogenase-like enzyme